jgi:hypothetical protein
MARPARLAAAIVGFQIVLVSLPGAAAPVVYVVFPATGTDQIEVRRGDPVRAEIRIEADELGVSIYGVSLQFDADLDLAESPQELLPPGFALNLSEGVDATSESSATELGSVLTCEAMADEPGVVNTDFAACRIDFVTSSALRTDGEDLWVGLFNDIDGLFSSQNQDLEPVAIFRGAQVDLAPEPAALALHATALSSLTVIASLRRRRARRHPEDRPRG